MANTTIAPMPLWILFSVPAAVFASVACEVAFGSNQTVGDVASLAVILSIAISFVTFPVAVWVIAVNPKFRTAPQIIGTTLCALPIFGLIASLLLGGI